jgi:hypothetical protein
MYSRCPDVSQPTTAAFVAMYSTPATNSPELLLLPLLLLLERGWDASLRTNWFAFTREHSSHRNRKMPASK